MKNLILPIVVLLLLTQAKAQTAPVKTGSTLTQQEAQDALDFHNQVRQEVDVPPLQWSAALSAYAQAWAENLVKNGCKMQHRPYSGQWAQQYGENIYWGKGRTFLPADASKSWYSEIQYYKHVPLTVANLGKVGHYTQMVWQGTTAVGMGKATCKDGAVIIVANYNPMGNRMGVKAY